MCAFCQVLKEAVRDKIYKEYAESHRTFNEQDVKESMQLELELLAKQFLEMQKYYDENRASLTYLIDNS